MDVYYPSRDRKYLGSGAFGTVYKDKWEGRTVAVKELNEPLNREIKREIEQLCKVDHPNIIRLYAVIVTDRSTHLIMQYAECGSLFDLLHKSGKKYNVGRAMSWSRQCAKGVAYMHGRSPRLIHRDLKSLNLLLRDDYKYLKICDFGSVADKAKVMTMGRGTRSWMAPEVMRSSDYTEKCDVYSWSIVLWEIFSRQIPQETSGGQDLSRIICCPQSVKKLMVRCWDLDPNMRPSMRQVAEKMESLRYPPDGVNYDFII